MSNSDVKELRLSRLYHAERVGERCHKPQDRQSFGVRGSETAGVVEIGEGVRFT